MLFQYTNVKSSDDGKMANGYRFRTLGVSIHGPAHRQFGVMVAVSPI